MTKALIGHRGYVGTTLRGQTEFDGCFGSDTIGSVAGQAFDTVICAAAPAQKWIADGNPEADRAKLEGLAAHLDSLEAKNFILISTVDVFADSCGKTEDSPVDDSLVTPYGRHRYWLEGFVRNRFPGALVVRLPGLVGPGLRKNAVFDLLNDNNVHLVDHRGAFQFYPMVNLWADLQTAVKAGLETVHLTAEPISIGEVAASGFGRRFDNEVAQRKPARYDLQSKFAEVFGGQGPYQYSARESLMAIRAYAQSEPRRESTYNA